MSVRPELEGGLDECRIVEEDSILQEAHPRAGYQALLSEEVGKPPVCCEGVGLSTHPIQGQH
jgi:hypothetical protein